MEKLIAYKMSVSEAEEILQNVLDDAGIRLVSEANAFYSAYSDSQELDGSQVDRRIAQYLGAATKGRGIFTVTDTRSGATSL